MDENGKFMKGTFYLTGMYYHDMVLQSYRMIFIGLEAVLFGFAYALLQFNEGRWVEWIAAIGILFCVLWMLICWRRGMYVWDWRERLLTEMQGTEADDFLRKWERGEGGWKTLHFMRPVTRCMFNFVLPPVVVAIWIGLLVAA